MMDDANKTIDAISFELRGWRGRYADGSGGGN